jgi:predicted RNA-binding protein YlqC (UPF0109 family)
MTHAETFAPVFLRLLQALADDPEAVQLDSNEDDTQWRFACDVNDAKKIIGKDGVRTRALRLVLELAGAEARADWVLAMPPVTNGEVRYGIERQKATRSRDYSPVRDRDLLGDTLASLGIFATVEAEETRLGVTLRIEPKHPEAATALHTTYQALFTPNQAEKEPLSLIAALGTIWRGIGGRQGIRYHIQVS